MVQTYWRLLEPHQDVPVLHGQAGRSAGGLGLPLQAQVSHTGVQGSVVHLDVEDCSEKLLRQHSYAIKNQLVASKAPYRP